MFGFLQRESKGEEDREENKLWKYSFHSFTFTSFHVAFSTKFIIVWCWCTNERLACLSFGAEVTTVSAMVGMRKP